MICESYGETEWIFNDQLTFPNNVGESGSYGKELEIIDATLQNSGIYQCYGLYKDSSLHFVSKAKIIVHGKLVYLS